VNQLSLQSFITTCSLMQDASLFIKFIFALIVACLK